MMIRPASAVLILGLMAAVTSPSPAPALGLDTPDQTPIEIFADDGIEWNEAKSVYIARGAARAVQGGLTVEADILTAHYRIEDSGETKIWRLNADGNVRIQDGDSTATAQRGLYDFDKDIVVLTGRKVTFISGPDQVTSDRSLEYWRGKYLAVARGNAVAVREDRTISSDVLSAYFNPAEGKGRDKIQRIEAFGNVKIITPSEIAYSEKGIYNAETGVASIFGSVKIVKDKNRLSGDYGEVNLKTGVSRLLAGKTPGERKGNKVKVVIKPAE